MTESTPSLDKARRTLGSLSHEELLLLRSDIDTLLTATLPPPQSYDGQTGLPDTQTAQGHIELKMINGYGPYKYLRRLENGRLKSIYLGKASQAEIRRYSPKRRRRPAQTD